MPQEARQLLLLAVAGRAADEDRAGDTQGLDNNNNNNNDK